MNDNAAPDEPKPATREELAEALRDAKITDFLIPEETPK